MSNFICSECGMTNIDCGGAGYKTPKEIELQKKLDIATKALEEIEQPSVGNIYNFETDELDYTKLQDVATKALKEINLVGTSVSLAKEEV